MANVMYSAGKIQMLSGDLHWDTDVISVALLSGDYVFSDSDTALDDLTGVLGSANISGKTITSDGAGDGTDVTSIVVDIGDTVESLVIYFDTGVAATSTLLFFCDTNDDGTPINRPGDGGGVPIIWANGQGRIFRLL